MAVNSALMMMLIVTATTVTSVTAKGDCVDPTFKRVKNVKFATIGPPVDIPLMKMDEDACKKACGAKSSCEAISFDYSTKMCHFMPLDYSTLKDKKNQFVSYTVLQRCPDYTTTRSPLAPSTSGPRGCITWSNFTNLHSIGAQRYSQYADVTSCLSGCISMSTCVAVDLDNNVNPPACWIYTDIAKVSSSVQLASGVIQYRVNRTCANTAVPLTTPASPFAPPMSAGNCFQDDPNDRDLPVLVSSNLTDIVCESLCEKFEFRYSGGQNGVECRCGNVFGKHGWSKTPCNVPCAYNEFEMCGGLMSNTIRKTDIERDLFSNRPRSNGRCFHDDPDGTELDIIGWKNNATNENFGCSEKCLDMGYLYSATKNGGDCSCINMPGIFGWGKENKMFVRPSLNNEPVCNSTCLGDPTQTCGGGQDAYNLRATKAQYPYMYMSYKGGCFADNELVPDLPVRAMWNDSALTPGSCVTACRDLNYPVSATQNGVHCFCGHTIGRYGWADYKIPKANCRVPCSGNPEQFCGGLNTNLYQPTSVKKRSGMCCIDNARKPDMSFQLYYGSQQMTQFKCISGCAEKGYPYAGLQDGTTCYCGYSYCSYGMAHKCGTPCSGDDTEDCGGRLTNFVIPTLPDELLVNRCFKDDPNHRDLPVLVLTGTLTRERCQADCKSRGFLFAGVQAGRQCWCGQVFGRHGWANDCNIPCSQGSTINCGGVTSNYIMPAMPARSIRGVPKCVPWSELEMRYNATNRVVGAMTRPGCVDACAELRFPYAAVEAGTHCYCGFDFGIEGAGLPFDMSDCLLDCPGDPDTSCGGTGFNYVMATNDHTWLYHTCNIDNATDPDMNEVAFDHDPHLTHDRCIGLCNEKGYYYAGMQNGNRCSCGNTFGRFGWVKRGCNIPCTGNPNQLCGGVGLNYVLVANVAGFWTLPPLLADMS